MSENPSGTKPLTPERIGQMAWGYAPPLIIGTAIHYKLFDLVDAAPKTAEELAQEAKISPRGTRMICDALVGLDLLQKDAQKRYALTPESATFLVTTKPSFQGGIFRHMEHHLIPKWLGLKEIVRTGKSAQAVNQQPGGAEFFQAFVEDIFGMSYGAAQALAKELKLENATKPVKVLDLAAGSGVWGIALAEKSPQVRVTAVDWSGVIPVTKRVAARHNVVDRFTFVEGDLHDASFGDGFDVATLGHILHSEGEARSRELLAKTAKALRPGGTIAIAEFLTNNERTAPPNALLFAVNMLVNTEHGDTFSFEEISGWLREAGFTNARTLASPGPSPLILATKRG